MRNSSFRTTFRIMLLLGAIALGGASAWGAITGVVSGTVTAQDSGAKLSGVNIAIEGTDLTTVTDAQGYYVITNVPPGTQVISAGLVGYADQRVTSVSVTMGVTTTVDIALAPKVEVLPGAEVEVTALAAPLRADVTPTEYEVTRHDEALTVGQPNNLYQWPGLVLAQPGAVQEPGGDVHIRGGRIDQVGYLLDGIPLTEPMTNLFGTNLVTVGLNRMQLYTGGVPAEFGNSLAGVANEVVKTGDQMEGGNFEWSLGSPWDFQGFRLEQGAVDGHWNWYFDTYHWRTNYRDIFRLDSTPGTHDSIGKVIYDAGRKDKLTLLSNQGYAKFILAPSSTHTVTWDESLGDVVPVTAAPDQTRQRYNLHALAWTHTFSPKAFLDLRVYDFHNRFPLVDALSEYFAGSFDIWYLRRVRLRGYQADYTNALSPRHLLKIGYRVRPSDNSSLRVVAPDLAGFEGGPFSIRLAETDTSQDEMYLQDHWKVSNRLTLDLGVRHDRMKYKPTTFSSFSRNKTSPRAGMTYELDRKTLLRSSWGRYAQFPGSLWVEFKYFFTLPLAPTPDMVLRSRPDAQVATNLDFGIERRLNDHLSVSATVFRLRQSDLLQFSPDAAGNMFTNVGRLRASGLELKLEQRPYRGWSGWLSYTHLRARTTAQLTGDPIGTVWGWSPPEGTLDTFFPADWDVRDSVIAVVSRKLGKWEITPWGEYHTGFPFGLGFPEFPHPLTGDPIPVLTPGGSVADSVPNSYRTDPSTVVSLNLSRRLNEDRTLVVSFYNLLNSHKVTQYSIYDPLGVNPVGFNDNGTPDDFSDDFFQYRPTMRVPPFNVRIGIQQRF